MLSWYVAIKIYFCIVCMLWGSRVWTFDDVSNNRLKCADIPGIWQPLKIHSVKFTYPVQRLKIASLFYYSLPESCMVCSCVCKSFFWRSKRRAFPSIRRTHTERQWCPSWWKVTVSLLFCLFLLFFYCSATARERKSCHVQRNMKEGGRKIENMGREPKSWKQEWPKNR